MLEPVPDPGPLLLRPRVGRWAAEGAATRVWLLQAGPGSGKAATARLLARALGKTAFYLEPGKQVPEQLAAWLDLPGGAAPERIAEALAIRLDRDAGGKAALVLSRADEASRAGTRAERFLRHWIAIADNRTVTIATARIPLDWLPVRAIAAGEVRILSAPDLWFDPDEALQVAPDLAGSPQTLQATCGWPLALAAAVRHAGRTGLRALLEDLATAELLNRLPSDLRDAALWLSPVGRFAPDDDPPGDPDHAAALGWLVRWGALVPGADGMAVWHPLLRRALREGQGANSAPAKRREGVARLGRWLERRDPARAFDFWLAEGEMDPAIATMVRLASPIPVSEATDRLLFGWLDRLPVQVREADPSVLLVEGTLLLRRGTLAGARDLLVAAHAGFADRGDLEGRFTALGRLLAVELQCEDAAGARKWATEAEALEPAGELGDRVVYHVNRGNLAFLERDEDLAMAHFRRALDFPHLGRARAALAQQEGCINLAILCYERGEYGQARRTLARALALHEAHPIDTFFPVRAALHLTLCALGLGDHAAAAALLGRLPAGSRSTNAYLDAVARRMEGHALLLLGQVSEADTKLRGALDAFAAQGVERTSDAAATLVLLAEAARRRKELDAGQILLDWAAPLAGPFPRLKANLALCRGLLHRDAGRLAEARAAFSDGEATLGSLCARPLAATLALCAAATAEELGDRGAAESHLAKGVKLMREGPYPFLPLAVREVAPRIWRILDGGGYRDILAATAERFPRAAAAVAREAARLEPLAPLLRDEAPPDKDGALVPGKDSAPVPGKDSAPAPGGVPLATARVEIRTFGQVSVTVGLTPVPLGRRKARALLAHLLLAPLGVTRDEAADLLYPDLDWDDARHQVDNLVSILRRALAPGSRRSVEGGPLGKAEGRYRLTAGTFWWDAQAYDRAFEAGTTAWEAGEYEAAVSRYAEALDLYGGDLCPGADLADWFEPARQAYRDRSSLMLCRTAEHFLRHERFEGARSAAERLLLTEPAHEGAHRILMRLYARLGEAGLVQKQFASCVRNLRDHLDVAPSGETTALLADLTAR